MQAQDIKNKAGFLQGGGEMGEMIRNFDWEQTPLGGFDKWPLTLRNTVGIVLHSAFPQFLFWGKDLISFYNDPFRPSLGVSGKHPSIGKKGKEIWPEIWEFIGPLIEKVMTTGEAAFFEDQLVPFFRNGKVEDIYWTFSYSPAYGDDGEIAGVFVTCTETTGKIIALKEMQENAAKFRALVEEAPVGTCLFTGREMKVEIINDIMIDYWGKGKTVLGKTLEEALPELKGQPFLKLLDDVYTTGQAYVAKGALVELEVDGVKGEYYFDFTYKPVRNASGEVFGIINVSIDATERVIAQRKLENSQKELVSYFEQSPVAIATLDKEDLTFRLANPFYGELVGRKPEDIINKPLLEALPELKGQGFDNLLNQVIETGIAYVANEISADLKRKGVLERIYVNLTYQPQKNFEGKVTGILVVATDVTQQVASRKKVEESEQHLQLLRDTVPAMIFYLDSEQRYGSYNHVFMDWFKVNATEVLGKTTRGFIGEKAYQDIQPYLSKAYSGEQAIFEMSAPSRMEGERWLSVVYTPHVSIDGNVIGVIVHATDITQSKNAEQSLRNSELFSHNIFYSSPVAKIVFTGLNMVIARVNENMLNILGRDESIVGKQFFEVMPELLDTPLLDRMREVYTTGKTFTMPEERNKFIRFGKEYTGYYSYIYKPLVSETGEIYGVMGTATEITEQVVARQSVEAKEKEWRELITAAPIGICVLNGIEVRIEEVNERFIAISGKKREQFVNATYWEVFPEVAAPFAPILENVFKTGVKFTTEEAELVLIRRGVPETMFATFEYIPVFDINNVVTKVIVMVIEVTHQVETRKQIEEAVVKRTKELAESNLNLKRSNEELEQFAYIASHDLQEPIRKISTFTQLLEHSMKEVSEKSKDYISKIYSSTDRMTNLIRDVLAFSRIRDEKNIFEKVELKNIIDTVKTDFELKIEQTQATIEVSNLPAIDAIPGQMIQLFGNLMSNALKYKNPNVKPLIKISSGIAKNEKVVKRLALDKTKKYYHIEFSDNGIGFNKEHADRIFRIFQRLHGKTEFEGTGIGLAICLKIVQNHQGHISASVGENGGAVFNILLPEVQNKAENSIAEGF